MENNRQSAQDLVDMAQRQSAILKRQVDAHTSLVHKGSFLPLPGLVNVSRGHRGRVTCLKILRVGAELRVWSGAADGTLRMWDLRSGKPLLVIQAHSVEVVGLDLLAVQAEAEQEQSTQVLSRTVDPKWAPGANKFKFEIADAHQMICVRVFAATQRGDVQLGNSAILLHDAFGDRIDSGQCMVASLDLPLLLASLHPNPHPQTLEPLLLEALTPASAQPLDLAGVESGEAGGYISRRCTPGMCCHRGMRSACVM